MAKSLLIICQTAPWNGISPRETLDIALAAGAFDLPVSLLFLDDGVFQLTNNQHPKTIEQKDLCANLQALPLFGIEQLFIAKHSLVERGLATDNLILPVTVLEHDQLAPLLKQYDAVVTG